MSQRRSLRLRETPAKNYSQTSSRKKSKLPPVLDEDEIDADLGPEGSDEESVPMTTFLLIQSIVK